MKRFLIVRCPKCGYEYLPEEIYYPQSFFGKPKDIIKDSDGKIINFEGESVNTSEKYECDNCGCTFDVDMKITIDTKVDVEHDFSEDYSTPIYKERLILDENNVDSLW